MSRTQLSVLSAVIIFAVLNLANVRFLPALQVDLTEQGLYTLSNGSKQILNDLEEPIALKFYATTASLVKIPGIQSFMDRVDGLLREYERRSGGKIVLQTIEPAEFSEEQDLAVAYGLQGIPVGDTGETGYFGLVGTNSVDDRRVIPLFTPEREELLEYDLTRLIYKLSKPALKVVGIVDTLGISGSSGVMSGTQGGQLPWVFYQQLQGLFELRLLNIETAPLPDDLDMLLLLHPKDLSDEALFQIDQFALSGKGVVLLVDPHSELDATQQVGQPNSDTRSDLNRLTKNWGIVLEENKIVGDLPIAAQVAYESNTKDTITYPVWINVQPGQLNQNDVITSQLGNIVMASVGALKIDERSGLSVSPLIQSTTQSMLIDYDLAADTDKLEELLKNYLPSGQKHPLAARVSGMAETAFPEFASQHGTNGAKQGNINAVIVADTDFLRDRFWIRYENLLGNTVPFAEGSNGEFVQNILDHLSGDENLIGIRSRGSYFRPFTRLEEIRRVAESQYHVHETRLLDELYRVENLLVEFSNEDADEHGGVILTNRQRQELSNARQNQIKIRQQLREVRKDMREGIESIQWRIRLIHIAILPLLVALLGAAVVSYGKRRRERNLAQKIRSRVKHS